jgi:hypothetical protein
LHLISDRRLLQDHAKKKAEEQIKEQLSNNDYPDAQFN